MIYSLGGTVLAELAMLAYELRKIWRDWKDGKFTSKSEYGKAVVSEDIRMLINAYTNIHR